MPRVNLENFNLEDAIRQAIFYLKLQKQKYITWRQVDDFIANEYGITETRNILYQFDIVIEELFPESIKFEKNEKNKDAFLKAKEYLGTPTGMICIRSYLIRHTINFDNATDAVMFRLHLDITVI